MLALVASIHTFVAEGVDSRDEHGHDGADQAGQPKKRVSRTAMGQARA
jgi:hypothetical protein